jgi:Na+-transporting methylmalonyl-CoA/oxaloacetate decarboxylase gamma subunit
VTLLVASSSTSAFDQPGTLGFLVVFGMAVILYFVVRSMSRQLRKVNDAARAEAAEAEAAEAAEAHKAGEPQDSVPDDDQSRPASSNGTRPFTF